MPPPVDIRLLSVEFIEADRHQVQLPEDIHPLPDNVTAYVSNPVSYVCIEK